jgi:glycosyltransferase involved in cell wall biosynthesis
MKVIVATPYYHPKIGGLENYARQLNIALHTQQDWEIIIVTSNHTSRKTTVETVDGMKVYRLGTLLKFSNTPLNPFWPFQIRSVIRQEHPDFILAHSPVPSMADAAALAAGSTPLVMVYHAATLLKGDDKIFNTIARLYRYYEQLSFRRAQRIFAVSTYVKEGLGKQLQSKSRVVPNAVWEREISTRRQPNNTEVLFIGSLDRTHAWKGLDQIIEAIGLYTEQFGSDIHLSVMGDGNYRQHYEAAVRSHGLDAQITFLGTQVGAEKDAYISAANTLVTYPTTANDAFPTVLLEAWAKGVPVIASAIGPIPSLITDGVNGFLVAAHDPSALAQTLRVVLTSPVTLRDSIAKTAARQTADLYTWERQATYVAKLVAEFIPALPKGSKR